MHTQRERVSSNIHIHTHPHTRTHICTHTQRERVSSNTHTHTYTRNTHARFGNRMEFHHAHKQHPKRDRKQVSLCHGYVTAFRDIRTHSLPHINRNVSRSFEPLRRFLSVSEGFLWQFQNSSFRRFQIRGRPNFDSFIILPFASSASGLWLVNINWNPIMLVSEKRVIMSPVSDRKTNLVAVSFQQILGGGFTYRKTATFW